MPKILIKYDLGVEHGRDMWDVLSYYSNFSAPNKIWRCFLLVFLKSDQSDYRYYTCYHGNYDVKDNY